MTSSSPAVLVTGGGGRLGRLVVSALRSRGYETLSLSRRPIGNRPDDLVADLTDEGAAIARLARHRIDQIIHLAASVHDPNTIELNASIDATLSTLIREKLPRSVILASTGSVYGDSSPAPYTESSPTAPASAYAQSKLVSEKALWSSAAKVPGLSVTVLRIFNIAGPEFPDSLVQRLLAADPFHPARLISPDVFVRDYIHQADVVRVIMAATARPSRGYRLFNVGAGVPVSTRLLLRSLGIVDEAWIGSAGGSSMNWADTSAMIRAFGIRPLAIPTPAWSLADPARDL